ncbi:sugar ABC transporter ATPase [Paraburkholderia phosphatilytica]|uniref:sugar ABC transporter ATPase n=1 Tax=Paraburkholderia phosphatilytica TaxID=2282883 RepID=UPI001F0C5337|nr:sugar ABC transporter ATPase [Paraburkholderia phosphatilytica]
MKSIPLTVALVAAMSVSGCETSCSMASATSGSSGTSGTSVSSSSTPGRSEATLMGSSGKARVAGDTIELKDGAVFVNGTSYGAVSPTQRVQYIVTGDTKTLLVDGNPRSPVH